MSKIIMSLLGIVWVLSFAVAADLSNSKRSKDLSFDDSVIEGVNRKPLDSLQHVRVRDKGETSHFYKVRKHFREEAKMLKQELRDYE
jgi:hypothetical protein